MKPQRQNCSVPLFENLNSCDGISQMIFPPLSFFLEKTAMTQLIKPAPKAHKNIIKVNLYTCAQEYHKYCKYVKFMKVNLCSCDGNFQIILPSLPFFLEKDNNV